MLDMTFMSFLSLSHHQSFIVKDPRCFDPAVLTMHLETNLQSLNDCPASAVMPILQAARRKEKKGGRYGPSFRETFYKLHNTSSTYLPLATINHVDKPYLQGRLRNVTFLLSGHGLS